MITLSRLTKQLVVLLVFVLLQTGCSKHNDTTPAGSGTQQTGGLSQAASIKVKGLGHQTHETHNISDADLEWTINLLKTSGDATARARAMTIMSEIRPMSSTQKAKIEPAIAPYLNSSDKLDSLYAKRVEKALQSN